MSDKKLCDSCKRYLMTDTCTIPYKDKYTEWVKTKDTLSADGSCVHYDKKTISYIMKEFVMGWWYYISHKVTFVYDFFKYKLFLYLKYGFDIRDTWNFNDSISQYIEPRLNYFINHNRQGTPSILWDIEFIKEHNLEQYFSVEPNDKTLDSDNNDNYEIVFDAWNTILNKIHRATHINNHKWDNDKYTDKSYNPYKHNDDVTEGFRLLGIFILEIWD